MANSLKAEIDKLLKTSPTFRDMYNRAHADAVSERLAQSRIAWPSWVEDALIGNKQNEKELAVRAVEEKVKELRERVKLDSIQKTAAAKSIPMSLKAIVAAEEKEELDGQNKNDEAMSFIKDFVSAHRGNCDTAAVMYELNKMFGHEYVEGNKEAIESFVEQMCKIYRNPQTFGKSDNSKPIQVGSIDEGEDRVLFKDIVKNLGNG